MRDTPEVVNSKIAGSCEQRRYEWQQPLGIEIGRRAGLLIAGRQPISQLKSCFRKVERAVIVRKLVRIRGWALLIRQFRLFREV
jgi:hypothetical protein